MRSVRRHERLLMLHPKQFEVNEAWIAFRLNGAPIRTVVDGDFHCFALMDAASCHILGSELTPAADVEPSTPQWRNLLKTGYDHHGQFPQTLFVPREQVAEDLIGEAARLNIEVVRVVEAELLVFIGDARNGYAERFEEPNRDA